jgi:hypothetical protein
LFSHRIAYHFFKTASGQSPAVGPAPDILTLYRLDRNPSAEPNVENWPGEAMELDFAAHHFVGSNCRGGLVQEDIANGLTACRTKPIRPENARQEDWATSYRAKLYTTPLGRSFVVNCDFGLFNHTIGSCRVAYVLKPGLGVSYKFQPYLGRNAIPINQIIDFDQSLRETIQSELVANYPWPQQGHVEDLPVSGRTLAK